MSQPYTIYWPQADGIGFADAIVRNQDIVPVGQNAPLQSNVPGVPNVYKFNKVIRSLDILSSDDLTGVTFVVSGIGTPVDGNGNPTSILRPITENIAGAPPGVYSSVNIYSQINSITITGADATNFEAGFGQFGITDYIFFDNNRTASSFVSSISLQFINNTTLTAAVYYSLNKPETPNIAKDGELEPFGIETLPTVTFIPAFSAMGPGVNADSSNQVIGSISVIWATVLDTTTDAMYFTYIQSGIS